MTQEISSSDLYGLIAEFSGPEELCEVARAARREGYSRMEAYSPYPIEGLSEAMGFREKKVAPIVLAGGLLGGIGGFLMQYYASVVSYPINIGGRPYNSWPAFIPITFELTVLGAGIGALIAVLALTRLPKPFHPVFRASEFHRVSQGAFFLCIEAADPKFDQDIIRGFFKGMGARDIFEVRS